MPFHTALPKALLAAAALTAAAGCSMPSFLITPVGSSPELEETVVRAGQTKREKVAVIEVEGMLTNARSGGGMLGGAEENKVSLFRQQLDEAANDDRVKALVLRVNSPGGTVAASDAMYDMVMAFKRRTGKPVVAHCQDVAASGGYYIAVAADEVHATESSVVGSIGVIFNTIDASAMLAKLGVQVRPLTSGPLKDMGSPFDGLDDRELAVMRGMIDEMYGQFVSVVESHRSVSDPDVAFDGRVFTGTGAAEVGLVDRVCGLDESISRAAELADARGATAVMYKRPYGYRGSIYASGGDPVPTAQGNRPGGGDVVLRLPAAVERLADALQPGMYYLWMP